MIVSLFVGTGEFVMCSINETCSVDLSVTFSFLEYTVSIPVGYTDRGQLEFVHLIVLGIYTILFTVLQVRLRTKMFQMERVANTNLNVMLVNVSKRATKLEIKELLERYGYGVDNIYLVKKMRPWLRVMNEKCRLKKQYLKACQKKELVEMGTLLNELREIDENLDQYYHLARNDMLYRTSYVIVRLRSEDQRDQLLKKCIVIFWAGTIVFRIMLADRQNFPNKMLAMWDNIYFRIEIGVVGAFLLIIYLFSLDEWFGKKLANRIRKAKYTSAIIGTFSYISVTFHKGLDLVKRGYTETLCYQSSYLSRLLIVKNMETKFKIGYFFVQTIVRFDVNCLVGGLCPVAEPKFLLSSKEENFRNILLRNKCDLMWKWGFPLITFLWLTSYPIVILPLLLGTMMRVSLD
jgi:hypothetical protein